MSGAGDGGKREWKRFGWQGITLTVPADWEMVSTKGDFDSGFVSLADSSRARLQLKWDRGHGNTDPAESASRYIRGLRKEAKKDDVDITVNRQLSLTSLPGKKIECYEWISDNRGTGMVSRCDECDRLVHIVLLAEPDEALRNLSRTVFASLEDHPENERIAWNFYDVKFESPSELPLKRSSLKTGCIRMQFQDRSEELEFVRVSLAQMLLKKNTLAEWFEDFYGDELKRHSYDISSHEYHGHEGLLLEGRPWLLFDPWRIIGWGKIMRAACWHCEDTNRIFIVGHGSRKREDLMEQIVQTTVCCADE